ncbi:MDR family MFS transporter [Falsarthrobacter nasiphocae]|uniref:DHA2 family lincomycin resistance protein-like MFS transporter n=1 Tax=Falsarthrobacter nasiphocae TaxID=189863 RepID=A0AAE4C574_9MICC|nr:MDR family MFS transporter [Falsarthrobacter nasiphocae]MDR6892056.1 DHA2 family lincomycin resistance protein-like MFS transporter [Falsarthrobacter nasiphocae]
MPHPENTPKIPLPSDESARLEAVPEAAPETPAMTDQQTDDQRNALPVIVILLCATFVVILNETLMNVALPHLMVSLSIAEVSTVQWVATAFMLTMSVVIPTTGFLLSRLTTRQTFTLAMGLFTLGTVVCAAAPSFPVLIVGRVIQASGTAVMMPLLMTTILQLVPLNRRGAVMGNASIAISVAPAVGPALSGLILQHFEWRFLFVFMLPVALLMLAAGLLRLKNVGVQTSRPLDWPSVLLTIPGFGGFVYGINEIAVNPGPATIVSLVVGLVCIVLFCRRQLALTKGGEPLLDLRVFTFAPFAKGLALMSISMIAMFGTIILFPLYMQQLLGKDSLTTGLLMLPGGLIMGLAAPPVGRLFDRIGARPLVLTGTSILVVTALVMSRFDSGTSMWLGLAVYTVFSFGLALIFTPTFTYSLNPLPPRLYSHGSATLSSIQQLAGGLGVALLTGVMQASRLAALRHGDGTPAAQVSAAEAGLGAAFLVAAGFAVLGVILAFRMTTTPAAAEPKP